MLINTLGAIYLVQAKQHEAEHAAAQYRLLQLCQQRPTKLTWPGKMLAHLGRLLVLIGTKLETRHQLLGA